MTEMCVCDGYRNENCVVIDPVAGEIVEYREHQRALAYTEVLSYLKGAGFTTVEAYKDFDG